MTRTFPSAVDVAIVGSGPAGAAYARILSEQARARRSPSSRSGRCHRPAGPHVKNIADPEERPRPAAVGGPARPRHRRHTARSRTTTRPAAGAAGHLPAGRRLPAARRGRLPGAAMSSNVGGMGAHWTGACPRPGDERAHRVPARPRRAARRGRAAARRRPARVRRRAVRRRGARPAGRRAGRRPGRGPPGAADAAGGPPA